MGSSWCISICRYQSCQVIYRCFLYRRPEVVLWRFSLIHFWLVTTRHCRSPWDMIVIVSCSIPVSCSNYTSDICFYFLCFATTHTSFATYSTGRGTNGIFSSIPRCLKLIPTSTACSLLYLHDWTSRASMMLPVLWLSNLYPIVTWRIREAVLDLSWGLSSYFVLLAHARNQQNRMSWSYWHQVWLWKTSLTVLFHLAIV